MAKLDNGPIKVLGHVYHRNGVMGLGFHTISFQWADEDGNQRHYIATVDGDNVEAKEEGKPHQIATRVLMVGATGGIDIAATMRGDHFHDELCKYISENPL